MVAKQAHLKRLMMTAGVMLLYGGHGGCIWSHEQKQKVDLGVAPENAQVSNSAAYRDTIGSLTYYEGLSPMRVRGYGLVVGLGRNGSRDCPKDIYTDLVQRMYKRRQSTGSIVGTKVITPEELIDDLDTAIVVVYGEIPPAAVAGMPFDVAVRALPGTQTESLRGGRLYTTDLEVFRSVSGRGILSGQVLARAAGPLFLNPFSDDESATKSDPLQGTILGGGRAIKDRRIRLVLVQPSYGWAQRIQDRINSRFPGPRKIADATSPSFIQLRVPQEYHDKTGHFLSLVRSLCLSRDPRFEATRARRLAQEIVHPDSPHADIALCFEGLGRTALPELKDLYAHPKDYVSFHAGVAGLRLGDHLACDAVVMHVQDPRSEYRLKAIRALAEAGGMAGAAVALRNLLNDEDQRVQIAAYEALVERNDATIDSMQLGKDNFRLDVIPIPRGDFVYAKRSASRRIALFGQDLRCVPPVFYVAPDGSVTINAREGDESLTLLRRAPSGGATSPPIPGPFDLKMLIKLMGSDAHLGRNDEVLGLGLDYGAVVRALHRLCNDRSVNARFILEQPNLAEMFGRPRPTGRPESDL